MQAGEKAYYDLQLLRADKKPVTVGHNIPDKREAEWLAGIVLAGLGVERGPDSRV